MNLPGPGNLRTGLFLGLKLFSLAKGVGWIGFHFWLIGSIWVEKLEREYTQHIMLELAYSS